MPDIRAFIALPLSKELQDDVLLLQKKFAEDLPGVRWVKPGQIHLTLRFFSALPEEDLDQIREIMLSIGNFCSPFTVDIRGFGAFPHTARPRVFWLGLTPVEPLVDLHRQLDEKLQAAGYEGESRPFQPHLTIGRPKKTGRSAYRLTADAASSTGGHWSVEQMVLYQSCLTPGGAIHTPLHRVKLSGTRNAS